MALEAPVVLAATLIALAATSALIAVLDTDSTTMSPAATESRARSMLATVSAAILFIAVLILLPDHRRLQRFTYTFGLLGLILLVLPLAPGIGTTGIPC